MSDDQDFYRYDILASHVRQLWGKRVTLRASTEPGRTARVDLPDDDETRAACAAGWLRPSTYRALCETE